MVEVCNFSKNHYPKFLVAENYIKSGSRNIYIFFYLRKLSRLLGKSYSTVLAQSKKVSIANAVIENIPQNRDNFLK